MANIKKDDGQEDISFYRGADGKLYSIQASSLEVNSVKEPKKEDSSHTAFPHNITSSKVGSILRDTAMAVFIVGYCS